MFATPQGWRIERMSDVVVLASQYGAGSIVVEENVRHAGIVPAIPGAERASTCEGERALVSANLAVVVLDDTLIRIEGRPADSAGARPVANAIQDIVQSTRVFLGEARRRRFWYEPPAGWWLTPAVSGEDTWLAPQYPHTRSALTVTHALPVAAREHVSIVKTLLGTAEDGKQPAKPAPISTERGLTGQCWTRTITASDGVEVQVAVTALTDGRFDYFARALGADPMQVLAPVLASIEPLPRPAPRAATSVMAHWVA